MRHAYRDAYPYEDLRDLGVIGAGAEAVRDEALTAIRRGKFWRVAAYFYAQKLLSDVTRDFLELFRDDNGIFCSLAWCRFNPEECLFVARVLQTYTPLPERSDEMLNLVIEISEHGIRQNPERGIKLLLAEQLILASKEWQEIREEDVALQVEMLGTIQASLQR